MGDLKSSTGYCSGMTIPRQGKIIRAEVPLGKCLDLQLTCAACRKGVQVNAMGFEKYAEGTG